MTRKLKLFLTLSFSLMIKCAVCQTNIAAVSRIDGIAAGIDSLKNYSSLIEDGTIEIKRKGIIKKVFTKRKVGGYSNYYYSDGKTKKLYKVIYERELGNPERFSYYFSNDTLILVKTLTWDSAVANKVLSSGQFYFVRDSLIKRTGNDTLAKPVSILRYGKGLIKNWSNKNTGSGIE
jgi:hypothetical protein